MSGRPEAAKPMGNAWRVGDARVFPLSAPGHHVPVINVEDDAAGLICQHCGKPINLTHWSITTVDGTTSERWTEHGFDAVWPWGSGRFNRSA